MKKLNPVIHKLRVIAGCALVGAVVGGTFFGWIPAMGVLGVHEIGAAIGAGLGALANAKNLA